MLVDTCVISYIYKGDTRANGYKDLLTGDTLYISFMTVAELYRWPYEKGWGEKKKQQLIMFLKNFVVLPYDDALAWQWAELCGKTCRDQPLPLADSWIAATALRHKLPLLTNNRKDFERIPGLTLLG